MKRRRFIKNTILGSVASVAIPYNSFSILPKNDRQVICWNESTLPILFDTDVLVIGGSFCGLSAAANFASEGKKVAVLDSKTFFGDEITAYLNFNLDFEEVMYPEPIKICKEYSITKNGHQYIKNDDVKREMEIMLEKLKIPFLYNTLPIHMTFNGSNHLIVVANKSGFQLVKAKVIIDCTPTSVTKYLMDDKSSLRFGENVSIVVEMYDVKGVNDIIKVPESLKVTNNQLNITSGYLNDGHIFFQFSSKLLNGANEIGIRKLNRAEVDIRLQAYEIVKYLTNNKPEFEVATYSRLSYYVKYDHIKEKSNTPLWAKNTRLNKDFTVNGKLFVISDFAGRYPNTWILPTYKFDYSAAIAANIGDQLSKYVSTFVYIENDKSKKIKMGNDNNRLDVYHLDYLQVGENCQLCMVDSFEIPLLDEYQIIVAGGGTSGATAGATAGYEGLKTLIIDSNNGLGGTGTFGGVHSYWYGREEAFNKKIDFLVLESEKKIKHKRNNSIRWNIEVKNYVLMKEAVSAGTDMIFHSFVVGTIKKECEVKGIVIATPYGVLGVASKLLIDATGDGDVAAFAGAEYVYGSATNIFPLYYSFGWSKIPGSYNTKFESMLDTRNIHDTCRAIIANRRGDKGKSLDDHATYLTPRETRHIKGDAILSLTDQLIQKQWSDVVNIHFSNNDIKGHHSSDWFRIGLIPPNLEVEIPLRALIPKGLDNIIVVGKAFSAKHDAFPTVRMQRDLENLGGVAALICSLAIKSDRNLRKIDINKLQKNLVEHNILPKEILGRKVESNKYDIEDVDLLISQLDGDMPLYSYSDMEANIVFKGHIPFVELCLLQEKAVPQLERALAENTGNKQILIAKSLAFIGSKEAMIVLANQIRENINHGKLPERTEKIKHADNIPPNQAAMPETAYLLNALAMCRDRRSIEIWREIVRILSTEDLDLESPTKDIFYYVDAICYGAEMLGDPETIPLLRKLHQHPSFNKQYSNTTLGMNCIDERKAMLELEIGTALARSGSIEGYEILVDYLDDNRAILAVYARNSLKLIQNGDFGQDKDRWRKWLNDHADKIIPAPIQGRMDG